MWHNFLSLLGHSEKYETDSVVFVSFELQQKLEQFWNRSTISDTEKTKLIFVNFYGFDSIKGGKGLSTLGQRIIYYRWFRKACIFMSGELLNKKNSSLVDFQAIFIAYGFFRKSVRWHKKIYKGESWILGKSGFGIKVYDW